MNCYGHETMMSMSLKNMDGYGQCPVHQRETFHILLRPFTLAANQPSTTQLAKTSQASAAMDDLRQLDTTPSLDIDHINRENYYYVRLCHILVRASH